MSRNPRDSSSSDESLPEHCWAWKSDEGEDEVWPPENLFNLDDEMWCPWIAKKDKCSKEAMRMADEKEKLTAEPQPGPSGWKPPTNAAPEGRVRRGLPEHWFTFLH